MKKGLTIVFCFFMLCAWAQTKTIRVGAKHFNEGYILSEMISLLLEDAGYSVERNYNLGGTLICFEALRNNQIDVYPEYSGTISAEILKANNQISYEAISQQLKDNYQMAMSEPFGFNNTYALVIKKSLAQAKKIYSISDLKNYPEAKAGISYEFLKREDGWDNLATAYSLPQKPVGLEHGLAYQALTEDKIDITDAYSTDGEIAANELTLLTDDLNFFPSYQAVALYRMQLPKEVIAILSKLEQQINESEMQAMNAAVLYQKKSFRQVAADFLIGKKIVGEKSLADNSLIEDVIGKAFRHLLLTFSGLLLAILVAVPLGVFLYWNQRLSRSILYVTGLLQTIPSIALLAIMIPLFGIGTTPAIAALFLYALLPILRNTLTGLQSVDPLLKKVADGIGMRRNQKLKWIELPLALPTILAGIRTAAVINVGTATLAAFIGAGGLGEYIVTGLALNNTSLILQGALPAGALAIVIELVFEWMEKRWTPLHLRS